MENLTPLLYACFLNCLILLLRQNTIDLQAEYDASGDYYHARNAYYATKGWFFSCDALCQRNQERMHRAERVLQDIRAECQAHRRYF
jgi:hypothetical protein